MQVHPETQRHTERPYPYERGNLPWINKRHGECRQAARPQKQQIQEVTQNNMKEHAARTAKITTTENVKTRKYNKDSSKTNQHVPTCFSRFCNMFLSTIPRTASDLTADSLESTSGKVESKQSRSSKVAPFSMD